MRAQKMPFDVHAVPERPINSDAVTIARDADDGLYIVTVGPVIRRFATLGQALAHSKAVTLALRAAY